VREKGRNYCRESAGFSIGGLFGERESPRRNERALADSSEKLRSERDSFSSIMISIMTGPIDAARACTYTSERQTTNLRASDVIDYYPRARARAD